MNNKQLKTGFIRFAAGMLLCAYLLFISWRMFFYAYGSYYRTYNVLPEYNLVPFKTIASLIINFRYYELEAWIYNLFGNVAAFMPLGLLLPVVLGVKRRFAAVIGFSTVFLMAAETAQLLFRVGVFDVDDIILNMLGVISGYAIYILLRRPTKA